MSLVSGAFTLRFPESCNPDGCTVSLLPLAIRANLTWWSNSSQSRSIPHGTSIHSCLLPSLQSSNWNVKTFGDFIESWLFQSSQIANLGWSALEQFWWVHVAAETKWWFSKFAWTDSLYTTLKDRGHNAQAIIGSETDREVQRTNGTGATTATQQLRPLKYKIKWHSYFTSNLVNISPN